jgi:hypothetical protein
MILSLVLPRIGAQIRQASIHKIIANPGDELRPGTPLLEIRVDIGSAKAQDCPPLSFFRIIATERAHLRSLRVEPGSLLESGALLGLASTDRTDSVDGAPTRALRLTSIAIQIDPLSR